jgi:hypothetical protein
MMFKNIFILLICFFTIGINCSKAQCDKLKKKRIYQMLGAAEYDNSRSTDILTSENTKIEEYQINLFKGVVYKLVFDASTMPEGVTINLYDLGKKRGVGKYELVFSSTTAEKTKDDTYEVTMEFPQRKMLVQYEVLNDTKPGCVSFVLGYYFKNNIR